MISPTSQWWQQPPCQVSLTVYPNKFWWPTSHQKDQCFCPVCVATCICSWAIPGMNLTSNQACFSYPRPKEAFASASECGCLCFGSIALLCVLLFVSLDIQPHRKCCGHLHGVTSSVQINREWGRAKALSLLNFFCLVSWTTKMWLLAHFPTSQALPFPYMYLQRGRSFYMCLTTCPRERPVVSAGDTPWAVREEDIRQTEVIFCFLTRQTNDQSNCAWHFQAPETLSPCREPQINEMENAASRFCTIRNHQTCTNYPCTSELCLISKAKIPDS